MTKFLFILLGFISFSFLNTNNTYAIGFGQNYNQDFIFGPQDESILLTTHSEGLNSKNLNRVYQETAPPLVLDKNSSLEYSTSLSSLEDYQIGPEWGKMKVTKSNIQGKSEIFQRAALSTAKFKGATAFYLGKFNGLHIMATNYHVLSSGWQCYGSSAYFDLYDKSFKCSRYIGSWSEVDFALFAIDVQDEVDEGFLSSVAQNMDFHKFPYKGQNLLTIGHGVAGNYSQELVAGQDSDCKVFSEENDIRFMADPDDLNPGDYSVWSFANGCDVSHGDSGSAMIDRDTGDIVGIIWTGRIPKKAIVRDPQFLNQIYHENSKVVWEELSYAAPSTKIYEVLLKYANNPTTAIEKRDLIKAIIK